ncbi:MAG: glycoside hydrolase family 28 protein, partial [Treponema sp.]|nr:glycoside hydrolase family 28 protein [Treponema sp.]
GGVLRVEPGIWQTGPLELFSGTTLILEEGAVISFIPDFSRYGPVWTRWEGVECYAMHPCLFASGQKNISIMGSGVLQGNGQKWWKMAERKKGSPLREPETDLEKKFAALNPDYKNQPSGGGGRDFQFLRPPLVQFFNCTDVSIDGITFWKSPFWTVHTVFCTNVSLRKLIISNPADAPNTDGIDVDSCENTEILNCYITTGDDGIVLKSGSGADGLRAAKPCRHVTVRGCEVFFGHGGIVIGSETAAGISDVLVDNCRFNNTDRGIRIKTRRGRGGCIENLIFRNLVMKDNLCPLAINMFYKCGADNDGRLFSQDKLPVDVTTPVIRNISITNINASGCRASAGFVAGLPESPVVNLTISQSEFRTDEDSGVSPDESEMFLGLVPANGKGIRFVNVKNPVVEDVRVHGPEEIFIYR